MSLPLHLEPIADPLAPLPQPFVASVAVRAVASLPDFADIPEPYRAAAISLGWGEMDGSEWWSSVMDLVG